LLNVVGKWLLLGFIFSNESFGLGLRVCLDGGFRRGREGRVYLSFLNYGHYEMFFLES